MPTRDEVNETLSNAEFEVPTIRAWDTDALPLLEDVLREDDELAPAATYAIGVVGGDDAVPLLRRASEHRDPMVRLAAAAGAGSAPRAARLLLRLIEDDDQLVRAGAVKLPNVSTTSLFASSSPYVPRRTRMKR